MLAAMSANAMAASAGSGLFRDHVLKGSPAQDRKNEVVEREKREGGKPLAEPDRTPVAGREHESVQHAVLPLGDEGAPEAEERREEDRDPQEAARREPG